MPPWRALALAVCICFGVHFSAHPIYAVPRPFQLPTPGETNEEAVLDLQRLLKALTVYPGEPTGRYDETTEAALRRFQAAWGLEATGVVDDHTARALGGTSPPEDRPRLVYTVRPGDTLSQLAVRYAVSVPWIARFNAHLTSIHQIRSGSRLVIPIDLPLPEGFRAERLQILSDRFLGTYVSDYPFSDVDRLIVWYVAELEANGYGVEWNERNPLNGITVRGRGPLIGRIDFRSQSGVSTRLDVGLLFTEAEAEWDLSDPQWISPQRP